MNESEKLAHRAAWDRYETEADDAAAAYRDAMIAADERRREAMVVAIDHYRQAIRTD